MEQPFFITAEELRSLTRFNSVVPAVENEKYFNDNKKHDFENENIICALKGWVQQFLVNNEELNSLLRILIKVIPTIPKDSKSLMDIFVVTTIEEEEDLVEYLDETALDIESSEEEAVVAVEPLSSPADPVYSFEIDEIIDPNYCPVDPLSNKKAMLPEVKPNKEPEKIATKIPRNYDDDSDSSNKEKFFNNFKCPDCSKELKTYEGLTLHRMKTHKIFDQLVKKVGGHRRKQCPICGVFRASLINHMRVHTGEKPYKCKFCEQGFKDQGTCRRHERTHTGEKPYNCTYCDKSFNQSTFRNEHMLIHTGEKPHKCLVCSKTFRTSFLLKTHHVRTHDMTSLSGNVNIKPYAKVQCDLCNRKFGTNYNLKVHQQLVHKGLVLFKCDICENKSFASNAVLKVHMMAHKGERPYNCIDCNKAFSQCEGLRLHNKRHHNIGCDEKFVCKYCQREFILSSYLKRHTRKMHMDKIKEEKDGEDEVV